MESGRTTGAIALAAGAMSDSVRRELAMVTRSKPNRRRARSAVLLIALLLACQALAGCGDSGKSTRESATHRSAGDAGGSLASGDYDGDDFSPPSSRDADKDDEPQPRDRDGDTDNRSGSYYDGDDDVVRRFGRPAGVGDRRAIESLVKRYFAAADAADGAVVCPMIVSAMRRAVVMTLGHHPPGPAYASGNTCAEVLSKVFRQNHRQLASEDGSLDAIEVRVGDGRGWAVLGFAGLPGRQLPLVREAGGWEIQALLDEELP